MCQGTHEVSYSVLKWDDESFWCSVTERCHLDVGLSKTNLITQDCAFLAKDRTAKTRASFRKTATFTLPSSQMGAR